MLRKYKFLVLDKDGNSVYNHVLESNEVVFSNNMFISDEESNVFEMTVTYETAESVAAQDKLKGIYNTLNELIKQHDSLAITVSFYYPSLETFVPIFEDGEVNTISFFTRFNDGVIEATNTPLIRTGLVIGQRDTSGSLS